MALCRSQRPAAQSGERRRQCRQGCVANMIQTELHDHQPGWGSCSKYTARMQSGRQQSNSRVRGASERAWRCVLQEPAACTPCRILAKHDTCSPTCTKHCEGSSRCIAPQPRIRHHGQEQVYMHWVTCIHLTGCNSVRASLCRQPEQTSARLVLSPKHSIASGFAESTSRLPT
jgi:hypothetical protein